MIALAVAHPERCFVTRRLIGGCPGFIQVNQLKQFSWRGLHQSDFIEILVGSGKGRQCTGQEDERKGFFHNEQSAISPRHSRGLPAFSLRAYWAEGREQRRHGYIASLPHARNVLVIHYRLIMLEAGQIAPSLASVPRGRPTLVVFFEADCPTCQLTLPYLDRLNGGSVQIVGIGQDSEGATKEFIRQMQIGFPVQVDRGLKISQAYDPQTVPTIFLLDQAGKVQRTVVGFDKAALNELAAAVGHAAIAPEHDGAPPWKPGCRSRHLEPEAKTQTQAQAQTDDPSVGIHFLRKTAEPAQRITLADHQDPFLYCSQHFGDALPVVPPTVERVQVMLDSCKLPGQQVIARVPPCYGEATVEKIAANAVMAGCAPEIMRVLVPLVRAVCDERFNIHGVQATTHFAAPLIIVNGPVRNELGFWSRQNVFSNVAQANSTLGRALQL